MLVEDKKCGLKKKKRGAAVESGLPEPPYTNEELWETTVAFVALSHCVIRDNSRRVLPWLESKRTGLVLDSLKVLSQMKVQYAFHVEVKVLEWRGTIPKLHKVQGEASTFSDGLDSQAISSCLSTDKLYGDDEVCHRHKAMALFTGQASKMTNICFIDNGDCS